MRYQKSKPRHLAAAIIIRGDHPVTVAELVRRDIRAAANTVLREQTVAELLADRASAQRAVWGPPATWVHAFDIHPYDAAAKVGVR